MNIPQKHTNPQANTSVSSVVPLWPDIETVAFTVLTSKIPEHALTKRFAVGDDGFPAKQRDSRSGPVPANSLAERVEINGSAGTIMRSFADRIANLTPQQAIILAPHVMPECVVPCVQKRDAENKPEAITKTRQYFPAPVGPALMGLDFDVSTWPAALVEKTRNHEDWPEGVLAAVFPAFAAAAHILRPSASAFVVNKENDKGTGQPGYHAYYPVKNAGDVVADEGASFAQRLHEHLVLAGYGFGFIAKTGHIYIRSLIDTSATIEYSRFWYEADATFADERLAYKQPRQVILKQEHGGFLDTSLLEPLTSEERQQYDVICQELQRINQPAADRARAIYLAERKAGLVSKGKSPEHADKILELAVERHILTDDFEVTLNDGSTVTVAEILADVDRYDGQPCPDPFEPGYGNGRSHAMILLSGATPHINSFAHGGRKFELQKDYSHFFEEIASPLSDEGIEVVSGLIDPSTIEVREYIIEPRLPRGDVHQLVGEPGAGKSQLTLLDALVVATGNETILRGAAKTSPERLHISGPVIVYNAEDRKSEMKRRLVALQKHYGITAADMKHQIILWSGVQEKHTLVLMHRTGRDALKRAPGYEKLQAMISKFKAVLVILDPQISLASGIDENSNDDMNVLLQGLANMASQTNSCIAVIHHTSKQKRQSAGDMGASRGAISQVGKVRSAYTLTNALGEDDLEKAMGILPEDQLVRLTNAKLSYSRKERPTFYRKVTVSVGNPHALASNKSFTGGELSPRERLLLEGDYAPVLEVVDTSSLATRAKTVRTSTNAQDALLVAQIVDEVMGPQDRHDLNGVWSVIGGKLRDADLTVAKARNVLTPRIIAPLLGQGVDFERGGQIVRIRADKKSGSATSPWELIREHPDKLSGAL